MAHRGVVIASGGNRVAADFEVMEQRTAALTEAGYKRLEASPRFLALVDQGIVRLVRSKSVPFGVQAGEYVGQALLEDGSVFRITEKVRGGAHALLSVIAPKELREAIVPSPVDRDSPVVEEFFDRFLRHLGGYLRHGRLKEYRQAKETVSSPRGRLDIRATVRLLSRGQRGFVAVERQVLTADLIVNQLLGLGLRAVESFYSARSDGGALVAKARTYAPLFRDVEWFLLARSGWSQLAVAFETALTDRRVVGEVRAALEYARALVLHVGVWPEEASYDTEIPHSYFLSQQSLFEDAVRQILIEEYGYLRAAKGIARKRGIFRSIGDRFIADPDVVLGTNGGERIVADCKYKELAGHPAQADIYQLTAHCSAFGCPTGLLVYPGDDRILVRHGTTNGDVQVWSGTVRLSNIQEDVITLVETLGHEVPTASLSLAG